jgi:hypothetical protein
MRNDLDLPVALLGDLHDVAEVADAAVDLDLVVQEFLEGGDVEDLVAGGLRGVDDELQSVRDPEHRPIVSNRTFLVIFCCFPLVGARVVFCPVPGCHLAYCSRASFPKRGRADSKAV